MTLSKSDLFRSKAAAKLGETAIIDFDRFHDRTQFKLKAARCFLRELKKLNQKAGDLVSSGISRFDVELNLDAFLYEVVGAIDPLLHEVNIAFQLGMKPWEVSMRNVISKLADASQLKKTLANHDGNTEGWFWNLREYRNHSAHRRIIGFYITMPQRCVYLHRDPRDPNSGRADEEVIEYCQNSLKRMEELIEKLYGLCVAEL